MIDKQPNRITATLEATNSVVHQTFEDLEDIGKTVDTSQMTLETLAKEFYKFKKNYTAMKLDLEQTIAEEVKKQIKPLEEKLDMILLNKPKTVYIVPRLPNPFSWIFRLIVSKIKRGGDKK